MTKFCPFCKEDKPIKSFQKTRSGGLTNKCYQCKYKDTKKIKVVRYVSIKEREKLKIGRE